MSNQLNMNGFRITPMACDKMLELLREGPFRVDGLSLLIESPDQVHMLGRLFAEENSLQPHHGEPDSAQKTG